MRWAILIHCAGLFVAMGRNEDHPDSDDHSLDRTMDSDDHPLDRTMDSDDHPLAEPDEDKREDHPLAHVNSQPEKARKARQSGKAKMGKGKAGWVTKDRTSSGKGKATRGGNSQPKQAPKARFSGKAKMGKGKAGRVTKGKTARGKGKWTRGGKQPARRGKGKFKQPPPTQSPTKSENVGCTPGLKNGAACPAWETCFTCPSDGELNHCVPENQVRSMRADYEATCFPDLGACTPGNATLCDQSRGAHVCYLCGRGAAECMMASRAKFLKSANLLQDSCF